MKRFEWRPIGIAIADFREKYAVLRTNARYFALLQNNTKMDKFVVR